MREVQRIEQDEHRLIFYEQAGGLYLFWEEVRCETEMELRQHGAPEFYWDHVRISGLYATLKVAERDAREAVSWLKDSSE